MPDPTQGYNVKGRKLSQSLSGAGDVLDRYQAGDFSRCVSTGLRSLDLRLGGGFHPGQVTLIGAPTGHGKTTLLAAMAAYASRKGPVLLVSPEMSATELAQREIIRWSGHEQWERNPWKEHPNRAVAAEAHARAMNQILQEDLPLYCLDDLDVTMTDVEGCARELQFEAGGIVAVFIDYAQEVAGMDDRTPRYLQVGQVATRSISLAREMSIPVVIASQINQSRDKQGNVVQTYRESNILEHKCHNSLLFELTWQEFENTKTLDSAYFVCRKQRNGPMFRLQVDYRPEVYRVEDWRKE